MTDEQFSNRAINILKTAIELGFSGFYPEMSLADCLANAEFAIIEDTHPVVSFASYDHGNLTWEDGMGYELVESGEILSKEDYSRYADGETIAVKTVVNCMGVAVQLQIKK